MVKICVIVLSYNTTYDSIRETKKRDTAANLIRYRFSRQEVFWFHKTNLTATFHFRYDGNLATKKLKFVEVAKIFTEFCNFHNIPKSVFLKHILFEKNDS